MANPGEYYDLRGILAPIGDVQRSCNVTVLPPVLAGLAVDGGVTSTGERDVQSDQ